MRVRTLYRNGQVYVPTRGFPTALLVDGTRVLWVGDEDEADAQAADAEVVVDLGGRLVTTPFVEPALLCAQAGDLVGAVDLGAATSLADALDRVAAAASSGTGPLLARDYDESLWPELRAPTPEELARASGDRPALMIRAGLGAGVACGALRALAQEHLPDSVTWPDELGPVQVDDLRQVLPRLRTPREHRQQTLGLLRLAAAQGIGAVHLHHGSESSVVELRGAGDESMPLPVIKHYLDRLCTSADEPLALVRDLGLQGCYVPVDGLVRLRRAALVEPYADAPGYAGPDPLPAEAIAEHMVVTSQVGVQSNLVAFGDRAAQELAAGLRLAVRQVGLDRFRALRHRTLTQSVADHMVLGTLIDLAVSVARVPQVDAYLGAPDGVLARRLGPSRVQAYVRLASLVTDGLDLHLTSTAPETPLDPWGTVRAARWHRSPEERLSVGEAFRAHTRAGWSAIAEDWRGQLDVGLPADLVVWDLDPDQLLQHQQERLHTPGLPLLAPGTDNPTAVLTVVGGRIIHSTEGALS
ncbi:amidohydrolase family protein [Arsenicicoccus dermatophilus]|uniref:amidohydrolase family protein n=1 Tax=Arsenicicoccus dermatophilus TaxID=1076331 RepID=UPI003917575D